MGGELVILLVTKNLLLISCAQEVVSDFKVKNSRQPHVTLYDIGLEKAHRFLEAQKGLLNLRLIVIESFTVALEKLAEMRGGTLGVIWSDQSAESMEAFAQTLKKQKTNTHLTSYSLTLFIKKQDFFNQSWQTGSNLIERVTHEDAQTLKVELLCRLMDYLDFSYFNRFALRRARQEKRHSALGLGLLKLMKHSQVPWILSYYTGSVVSTLIKTLEDQAHEHNGICIRGPSEHALACGALANYLLFDSPFLIVVTSGMMDEFKGTLINLKQARSRGIIVCANNPPAQWHAFQGGISATEDIRQVLDAKRICYLSVQDAKDIPEQLLKCQSLLQESAGPIVLLAEQQVLESVQNLDIHFADTQALYPNDISAKTNAHLDRVCQIINNEHVRILWQCNRLTNDERALVYDIAQSAGIGLCDSLIYPGSVCEGDAPPKHYLGTLGLYGVNAKIRRFLFDQEELRPKENQWLFFLKSKVGQVASPFSELERQQKLQIVQLDKEAHNISPFADIALAMPLIQFLSIIKWELKVDQKILAQRRGWLQEAHNVAPDVLSKHAIAPLSANYFFGQLDHVIRRSIQKVDYRYTGVYDVGRFGMSAIRDVTRTSPGFSGWYGKALMGDAYLSILSLMFSKASNILGFIGDGAKNLVPAIEPFIVEHLSQNSPFNSNVTIFFGMNGTTSLIETYQDRMRFEKSGRQMRIVNNLGDDKVYQFADANFRHITLREFNPMEIEDLILAPKSVNFVNVVLSHNSEAAGISSQSYQEWQTKY